MGLGQLAEFVYTVILKPRPLRVITNSVLKLILPRQVKVAGASLSVNPADPVVSGEGYAVGRSTCREEEPVHLDDTG